MLLILAALALSFSPLPAHAVSITEPIVFDFEDGLQGWELHGSAQRVQTQILGGEWAIFGDGFVPPLDASDPNDGLRPVFPVSCEPPPCPTRPSGTSISASIDLTGIAFVSLEQFFVEGDGVGPSLLVEVDIIENIFVGTLFVFEPVSPGNPNLWAVDLSEEVGIRRIAIVWADISGAELAPIVGFIDNITFHPIPEPAHLGLLGLLGVLGLRRVLGR